MTNEEFNEKAQKVISQAILFAEKARREGLLALDDVLEDIETDGDRDILKYGLRLVVDGIDKLFIEKVLSNIIEQEKDEYARKLKILKKEAVLMIQEGMNTMLVAIMLFSYLDEEFISFIDKSILEDDDLKKVMEKLLPRENLLKQDDDDLDLDAY